MKTDFRLIELYNALSGDSISDLPELFTVSVAITDKISEDLKVRQVAGGLLQCIMPESKYHLYCIDTRDVIIWFPEIRK
jgi:hypothetical protein